MTLETLVQEKVAMQPDKSEIDYDQELATLLRENEIGKIDYTNWQFKVTKGLDLFLGAVGLAVYGALVYPIVGAAIKLEGLYDPSTKGPVHFVQERVGLNGEIFKMPKFRSMRGTENENFQNGLNSNNFHPDASRVTRVGYYLRKLKLDEIPNFIGVFHPNPNKRLSLVGHRAIAKKTYVKQGKMHPRPFVYSLGLLSGISSYEALANAEAIDCNHGKERAELKMKLFDRYEEGKILSTYCDVLMRTALKVFHLDKIPSLGNNMFKHAKTYLASTSMYWR